MVCRLAACEHFSSNERCLKHWLAVGRCGSEREEDVWVAGEYIPFGRLHIMTARCNVHVHYFVICIFNQQSKCLS